MKEIYYCLADDGTKFDDRWECLQYERQLVLKEWKDDFVFLDSNKKVIPIEKAKTGDVFYIIIKNKRCAPAIGGWFEEDGCYDPFDGMYDKTVEGTWVWGDIIDKGEEYYLVEFEIEKLKTLIAEVNK